MVKILFISFAFIYLIFMLLVLVGTFYATHILSWRQSDDVYAIERKSYFFASSQRLIESLRKYNNLKMNTLSASAVNIKRKSE